jgi:signal transduction histidine kinase
MVKKVIEMHGGNIEVETRLGEGSLFRVRLPADQQTSGEAVA